MENKPLSREKLINELINDNWWNTFRARHNVPPVSDKVVNDLVKFCRRHKQTKTNYTDP